MTGVEILGTILSTVGGLGLGWGESLSILVGNLSQRVDAEFRLIYTQVPAGQPSRDWKANRLLHLKRGRWTVAFWLTVFLAGVSLLVAALV